MFLRNTIYFSFCLGSTFCLNLYIKHSSTCVYLLTKVKSVLKLFLSEILIWAQIRVWVNGTYYLSQNVFISLRMHTVQIRPWTWDVCIIFTIRPHIICISCSSTPPPPRTWQSTYIVFAALILFFLISSRKKCIFMIKHKKQNHFCTYLIFPQMLHDTQLFSLLGLTSLCPYECSRNMIDRNRLI